MRKPGGVDAGHRAPIGLDAALAGDARDFVAQRREQRIDEFRAGLEVVIGQARGRRSRFRKRALGQRIAGQRIGVRLFDLVEEAAGAGERSVVVLHGARQGRLGQHVLQIGLIHGVVPVCGWLKTNCSAKSSAHSRKRESSG